MISGLLIRKGWISGTIPLLWRENLVCCMRQDANARALSDILKRCSFYSCFLTGIKGDIPLYVCDILTKIIEHINAPFGRAEILVCSNAGDDLLSYFPELPITRSTRIYKADRGNVHINGESCRKDSWSHFTLTPGPLSYFPGLPIMRSTRTYEADKGNVRIMENPAGEIPGSLYPFPGHLYSLLWAWNLPWVHRFGEQRVTKTFIWNFLYSLSICSICHCIRQFSANCTNVLNREPSFFKKTKFLVYWFHWHGHIACLEGYNLSVYKALDFEVITSQINEQEKSSVQIEAEGKFSIYVILQFPFPSWIILCC